MATSAALPLAALLVLVISWAWEYLIVRLIWRPYAMAKRLRAQGIHGPPYRFLKGSNEEVKRMKAETAGLVLDVRDHNYLPRVAPHFLKWRAQCGEPFLFWFGAKPRICIFDYELARQILSSKSGHFPKNDVHPNVLEMLGKGLVLVNGVDWVRHRRVIDPAFAMDKIKAMTETSLLLIWTVFLLSVYPEWQERLREEVLREVGMDDPSGDNLGKLKEMTMVLHETLRLYGPALFVQRKPITDMVVGDITIPKDHAVVIGASFMHRDKKVWGEDADQFNPMRFANGVARAAKVLHALLAFSIGPRACIGQNFAMLEAKSVMATVLQKFSFALSPSYVHAPADLLTLQPKFGLPVVMKLLDV